MDHGFGRLGQRPHSRPAIQGKVPAHIAADFGRRHREIPLLWHDPGRGTGLCQKKLVRAFGDKVFDIIETTPDRLRQIDGIGPVRAASILAAWAEQKAVREIMVFLHSHGVSTARAVRIFKTYGSDAIQVMSENHTGSPAIFVALVSRLPTLSLRNLASRKPP